MATMIDELFDTHIAIRFFNSKWLDGFFIHLYALARSRSSAK